MVVNATFNYISVISWLSVLLVEETGVQRENIITYGLCSRATSNGVIIDNSAPIPGLVVVGDPGMHTRYQSHT
jgi:hypothetical protein